MRKIFYTLLMTVAAFVLTSCSSTSSTPGAAAKTYMEYLKDGKVDKFVEGLYFDESVSKEDAEESKAMFSSLMNDKVSLALAEKDGISKIEVLDEDIDEEDGTADVTLLLTFGNGETSEDDFEMVKDANGEWKMRMKK